MNTMLKLLNHRIRNDKGQVAIFVALIFPVLFLFFAMIINVGLLVHHKINLQNSVDLAAYYGAGKQAEMLNAIGHTNYQIRQSWKLLTWRYRQLGTAGDMRIHPYNKISKKIDTNRDIEGYPQGLLGNQKDFYEAPAFCITYTPFHPMPQSESLCKDQSNQSTITLFKPPPVIAGFLSINQSVADASRRALENAGQRCELVGSFNYFILGEFLVSFNRDQGERKQLINMLSRGLSELPDNFREINGDLASTGIRATLENNLTDANKDKSSGLKVTIINGLGLDGCNGNGRANTDPAKWLSEVKISPAFNYMDWSCDTSSYALRPLPKFLSSEDPSLPRYWQTAGLATQIKAIQPFLSPLGAPYNSSIGYEKNPWCMSYVGVKAETKPIIPFMPLSGITLKAQAYAKPFGGKIGPWYTSLWPSGSDRSTGGQRTDPLLPIRLDDSGKLADYKDTTRAPNYSRFVGDKFGLKSNYVLGQWGKAIHSVDPTWNQPGLPSASLNAEPNFNHWAHLADDFKVKPTGDLLAWDSNQDRYPTMRRLELAAILPDQFDLTYYSIEPDFYHNYFKHISEEYVKKVPGFSYMVRPDIGARLGNKDLTEFSVREQYKVMETVATTDFQIAEPKVDFENRLMYVAKDVVQVLTSWIGKDLTDYSLDTDKFGKCTKAPVKNGGEVVPNSGDCIVGGRTGYSVKLVSTEYLKSSDLDLGGEGTGTGKLLNPPPE